MSGWADFFTIKTLTMDIHEQTEKRRLEILTEIEKTKTAAREKVNQLKGDLRFLTNHPKLYFETAKATTAKK